MQFELGTPVHTEDGHKVGTVDRVVLSGQHGPVEAIVVHEGFFFTHHVLVPMKHVKNVDADGVYLNLDKQRLNELPEFIETEFTYPPEGTEITGGFALGSTMFPQGVEPGVAPMIVGERKHLAPGTSDIGRGYAVRCKDSDLGIVKDVLIDGQSDTIDALIVEASDPELGTVRIPASAIVENDDDVIVLNCTKDQLKAGLVGGK